LGTPEIAKSGAHAERDALSPKRIPAEPQQDEQKDNQKPKRRIPTLMFHYRVLGCLWVVFGLSSLPGMLQSVADCFRCGLTAEIVADGSQTVAIGCKTRKSADLVSR
jgi:hypothetical protein